MTVLVIESRQLGGTCALRGCNPKKVLVHAAELIDHVRLADGRLVDAGGARITWENLLQFQQSFVRPVPDRTQETYSKLGIETIIGQPRFVDTQSLTVGDRRVSAGRIAICTGSRPRPLAFPGSDLLTASDGFLTMPAMPRRLVFVGGGYISMEFAHIAARCGAEVTVIEHNQRPLKGFEPHLVDMLVQHSQDIGIDLKLNASVNSVARQGSAFEVKFAREGAESSVIADMVVHGAGRVPSTEGLDLKAGNVESDDTGIKVNEYMQSVSNSHVYAAGDVVASSQPKLTPVANQQGRAVQKNLIAGENTHRPEYGVVPRVAFTVPPIASIGLSENEADQKGIKYDVRVGDLSDRGSLRRACASVAGHRVLIEQDTGRIIGAHLLGADAAETINLFALAMKFNLTAADVKSTLLAFPTNAADVRSMV
jgi:glutathione reductase (NADPH)